MKYIQKNTGQISTIQSVRLYSHKDDEHPYLHVRLYLNR